MRFNSLSSILSGFSTLLLAASITTAQSASWQITSITSTSDSTSNSTIFSVSRGSQQTSCSFSWSNAVVPNVWTKCSDTLLRFRLASYISTGNLALQIVQATLDKSTTPASVGVVQTTFNFNSANSACTATPTGQQCTLTSPASSPTNSSSLAPKPLSVFFTKTRDDGSTQQVTPCSQAYTIYIVNPVVTTCGPITQGRYTDDHQWRTHCDSNWDCGVSDPLLNGWASCAAPAYQYKRTIPPGGNEMSNFILSVTHTFPLMMSTSIRGYDTPDTHSADPLEAPGLSVRVTGVETVFKLGTNLQQFQAGITPQPSSCEVGCTFLNSGTQPLAISNVEIL